MRESSQYRRLLDLEAAHWGSVRADPLNPQIWHDPVLFEIFFGKEFRFFTGRIVQAGKRVLELGCGEGGLAIELARRGCDVRGIDLSAERIRRARAAARTSFLPKPPRFEVGDLNVLTLKPQTYDCIVAHDALHHVLHLNHLLDQVRGALRSGGTLLVLDFIGMGKIRKLLAAALFAVLPTYRPYAEKWRLRKRLKAFLADEATKRKAIATNDLAVLHADSPFEEVTQASLLEAIGRHFSIITCRTFNPFWYYIAPKIRLQRVWRPRVARLLREMDDEILQLGLARGAYVFVEARKIDRT